MRTWYLVRFFVLHYLSVDVVLCFVFGIIFLRYCTACTMLHRGGCKQFTVHGFGGSSAGLEATLTSYVAAGKDVKYNERPSATSMTVTVKRCWG